MNRMQLVGVLLICFALAASVETYATRSGSAFSVCTRPAFGCAFVPLTGSCGGTCIPRPGYRCNCRAFPGVVVPGPGDCYCHGTYIRTLWDRVASVIP